MELKRIFILYFSPTGGTRRVARILLDAARKSGAFLEEADLTPPEAREAPLEFEAGDLVFWAAPSYGGRLPKPFHDYRGFAGRSAWGVPVAVYGNRHFDDQLAEMQDVMEACGFTVPAGAAFIARHNQHPLLGAGRPDAEDRKAAESFVGLVIEKIRAADAHDDLRVALPGHRPYKPYGKVAGAPREMPPLRRMRRKLPHGHHRSDHDESDGCRPMHRMPRMHRSVPLRRTPFPRCGGRSHCREA